MLAMDVVNFSIHFISAAHALLKKRSQVYYGFFIHFLSRFLKDKLSKGRASKMSEGKLRGTKRIKVKQREARQSKINVRKD